MSVTSQPRSASLAGADLLAAVKEAGVAALIALVLAVIVIGMRTVDQQGGLGVEFRPAVVAIAVGLVFAGRVLLVLWWRRSKPLDRSARDRVMDRIGAEVLHYSKYAGLALFGFAVAVPFIWSDNRYVVDIATLVLTYIMLGWGLNIVVGLAGLLDLGYVAFYAVGAYSYALIALHFDLSFWACLPLAGLFAASFGVLLGFPVLRLRGDYLAIVTLGFGEIIRVILLNWYSRGGNGLPPTVRLGLLLDAPDHLPLLPDPGPGAGHQFLHAANPQAAGRAGVGGVARG